MVLHVFLNIQKTGMTFLNQWPTFETQKLHRPVNNLSYYDLCCFGRIFSLERSNHKIYNKKFHHRVDLPAVIYIYKCHSKI